MSDEERLLSPVSSMSNSVVATTGLAMVQLKLHINCAARRAQTKRILRAILLVEVRQMGPPCNQCAFLRRARAYGSCARGSLGTRQPRACVARARSTTRPPKVARFSGLLRASERVGLFLQLTPCVPRKFAPSSTRSLSGPLVTCSE